MISNNVFIDVLDSVTLIPKLGRAVEGPYQMLGPDLHTVSIQRKTLVERITAERLALAPWSAGVPPLMPELASVMDL